MGNCDAPPPFSSSSIIVINMETIMNTKQPHEQDRINLAKLDNTDRAIALIQQVLAERWTPEDHNYLHPKRADALYHAMIMLDDSAALEGFLKTALQVAKSQRTRLKSLVAAI